MPIAVTIKPTHKAILAYYEALKTYEDQKVSHELAVKTAFQNLLIETGKLQKWTLVPELSLKVKGDQYVRPDGTMRDGHWLFPRGYWEAKDTNDTLADEIRKKIAQGYPLLNTIFEDTREGVLYQDGKRVMRANLSEPIELAGLLNQFYAHTERDFQGFEQAVEEFKDHIPSLGKELLKIIQGAHENNPTFQAAFNSMLDLCRTSLNPKTRDKDVDDMLVQHLLTERIFERVFKNKDFVRRNVIASEMEKVIDALVIESFNRDEYLKPLDPFYSAIEHTAATITDFSEKQFFINTVYETFFKGFSPALADTMGIVYTPQAIVDFMCVSVEEVLKKEFKKTLGGEGVNILDPCTGTGNYLVNLLRRIDKGDLARAYEKQLFANEVMLLPYYVASQNIEHEYHARMGKWAAFNGVCFVDTLELAEEAQKNLSYLNVANTERVRRQKNAEITVIIGNPPYNIGRKKRNDPNKNRKYPVLDKRIKQTYAKSSKASLNKFMYDHFVRFFRWATDRLGDNGGIVCYITNNSFVHKTSFDSMRKHLFQDFTRIYHLDLLGEVRADDRSGTAYNVFGIQLGVGITLAIRSPSHRAKKLFYYKVDETWKKEEKLTWLTRVRSIRGVPWQQITPDARHDWMPSETSEEFSLLLPMGSKEAKLGRDSETIFSTYSLGVSTNRDRVLYNFNPEPLARSVRHFAKHYNAEVDRFQREWNEGKDEQGNEIDIDDWVDKTHIKWSRNLEDTLPARKYLRYDPKTLRRAVYRPFVEMFLNFQDIALDEFGQFKKFFPTGATEGENRIICVPSKGLRGAWSVLMTDRITDLHCASGDGSQCFPLYVYDEDGSNRRDNITDWALGRFRDHYEDEEIAKQDIFYYIYGLMHQPDYRERFDEDLRKDLPRIPLTEDFRAFSKGGRKLANLHLGYHTLEPWPLEKVYTEGVPPSLRVTEMSLNAKKTELTINESLKLTGIPAEAFVYRLGRRSPLEWLIDQFKPFKDEALVVDRNPNRQDDPEYIIRLVERVVRVSVETVNIVKNLPSM